MVNSRRRPTLPGFLKSHRYSFLLPLLEFLIKVVFESRDLAVKSLSASPAFQVRLQVFRPTVDFRLCKRKLAKFNEEWSRETIVVLRVQDIGRDHVSWKNMDMEAVHGRDSVYTNNHVLLPFATFGQFVTIRINATVHLISWILARDPRGDTYLKTSSLALPCFENRPYRICNSFPTRFFHFWASLRIRARKSGSWKASTALSWLRPERGNSRAWTVDWGCGCRITTISSLESSAFLIACGFERVSWSSLRIVSSFLKCIRSMWRSRSHCRFELYPQISLLMASYQSQTKGFSNSSIGVHIAIQLRILSTEFRYDLVGRNLKLAVICCLFQMLNLIRGIIRELLYLCLSWEEGSSTLVQFWKLQMLASSGAYKFSLHTISRRIPSISNTSKSPYNAISLDQALD